MRKKIGIILIFLLLISNTTSIALTTLKIDEKGLNKSLLGIKSSDSTIIKRWNKTFGGVENDEGHSVQQTTDGGYIITGDTESFGAGLRDVWLIKTDENGNKEWDKTFGGMENDGGHSVQQTTDGGYVIVGYTESFDNNNEYSDVWLIKTDSNGKMIWNKTYGRNYDDVGYSVQQTNDGGYIITGCTKISGSIDVWLIKTDENGNREWDKIFGSFDSCFIDRGHSVQQTTDGGYIITGYTIGGCYETHDVWLIKTDGNGNRVWDKTFDGINWDGGYSIQQTIDGGYIITGYTESFGVPINHLDIWLIKTDSNGKMIWNSIFGRSGADMGYSVHQTNDSGYIIVGYTESFGTDNKNVWLVKTDSNGKMIWNKTYGGTFTDMGNSVHQTNDGGYIIIGQTDSFGYGERYKSDFWLIKTDENGIFNYPPNKPTITGETNGKIKILYDYIVQTTDPDQNNVKYIIDWNDGNTTITGFNESGEEVKVSHMWSIQGLYYTKVKTIDENNAESDWTTLEVSITKSKSYVGLMQLLLENFFQRFSLFEKILNQII
jgi:hypothetical protein